MARKDDDKQLVYRIPPNFEEKSVTANGIPYRNLVEAVILVGIVVLILWKITIAFKTKCIIGIAVGGPLAVLAIFGINKCSLSEFLLNIIKYKMRPKLYVRKKLYVKSNSFEK